MPEIGNNNAATVATQLLNDFKSVRFGLLVGIESGMPSDGENDIRLGAVRLGTTRPQSVEDCCNTPPTGLVKFPCRISLPFMWGYASGGLRCRYNLAAAATSSAISLRRSFAVAES